MCVASGKRDLMNVGLAGGLANVTPRIPNEPRLQLELTSVMGCFGINGNGLIVGSVNLLVVVFRCMFCIFHKIIN